MIIYMLQSHSNKKNQTPFYHKVSVLLSYIHINSFKKLDHYPYMNIGPKVLK